MTVLYGAALSPFVRKTMLALAYKGVEYDQVIVSPENRTEDFFRISPLGKIPAYKDDRTTLCDSTVICEYLDEKYPTPELFPFGAAQRAKTRWYEEYADTVMAAVCGPKIFANRVLKPLIMGEASDEDAVNKAMAQDLPIILDYLEKELADKRYFVAGILSMADLAISSQLLCLRLSNVSLDMSRWPRLGSYLSRLCGKDIYQTQIKTEDRIIERLKEKRAVA